MIKSRRMMVEWRGLSAGGTGAAGLNGNLVDARFADFVEGEDRSAEPGVIVTRNEDAGLRHPRLQVFKPGRNSLI